MTSKELLPPIPTFLYFHQLSKGETFSNFTLIIKQVNKQTYVQIGVKTVLFMIMGYDTFLKCYYIICKAQKGNNITVQVLPCEHAVVFQ